MTITVWLPLLKLAVWITSRQETILLCTHCTNMWSLVSNTIQEKHLSTFNLFLLLYIHNQKGISVLSALLSHASIQGPVKKYEHYEHLWKYFSEHKLWTSCLESILEFEFSLLIWVICNHTFFICSMCLLLKNKVEFILCFSAWLEL